MSLIYKGRVITVKKKSVKFSDGHTSDYDFVIHKPAVAIVPVINKKSIMLVRQYRPVVNEHLWELPAGIIDKGETPYQTAKRELEEETGLKAKNMIKMGECFSSPGFTNEKTTLFLAQDFIQSKQKLDKDEEIEFNIFSFKDIINKINNRKITDAKTILGVLWVKEFINIK